MWGSIYLCKMRLHHLSHPTLSITKWLLQTITVWDHFVYNWQYKNPGWNDIIWLKNNHAAPHDIKTDVMIDPKKIVIILFANKIIYDYKVKIPH